jgi:hypothetical protein
MEIVHADPTQATELLARGRNGALGYLEELHQTGQLGISHGRGHPTSCLVVREALRRCGRTKGPVWPLGVVVDDVGIDAQLRGLQAGESSVVEQLHAQGPMKTLDLAGRGRMRGLGEQVANALLLADAVEEHDRGMRPREPAGEHPAVVGEQLVRHPMPAQRSAERRAHRARIGSLHHAGTHAESRMVVDAGEQ